MQATGGKLGKGVRSPCSANRGFYSWISKIKSAVEPNWVANDVWRESVVLPSIDPPILSITNSLLVAPSNLPTHEALNLEHGIRADHYYHPLARRNTNIHALNLKARIVTAWATKDISFNGPAGNLNNLNSWLNVSRHPRPQ
jgi:hypothetical protein